MVDALKPTFETAVCGNRVLIWGRVGSESGIETWLYLNGEPVAQDLTLGGEFHYALELPMGIYRIRIAAYRVPVIRDGKLVEETVYSNEKTIVIRVPKPLRRIAGAEVCNKRQCYTFSEVMPIVRLIARDLKAMGYDRVYLTGGLLTRGWSCQDIDIYIDADIDDETRHKIQHQIMKKYCVRVDIFTRNRPTKKEVFPIA